MLGLGSNGESDGSKKKELLCLLSFFTNQKGVALEFHSWGARGRTGDRRGGDGTQPRVAARRGRSISGVGGGRMGGTNSSQNLANGRDLIKVGWINEGGRKHQQKTWLGKEPKHRVFAASLHLDQCLWGPFYPLPSGPLPLPPGPH